MYEGLSVHRAWGKVWKVLERQEKRCGWKEMDFSRGAHVNQQREDSRRTCNTGITKKKRQAHNIVAVLSASHPAVLWCVGGLSFYSQKAITWSKHLFSLEREWGDYQTETTEGHVNDKPNTFVQMRVAVNWCIAIDRHFRFVLAGLASTSRYTQLFFCSISTHTYVHVSYGSGRGLNSRSSAASWLVR